MTLFILDTDSASLFLGGNQKLIYRVIQEVPDVVTKTVIVQELFNRGEEQLISSIFPELSLSIDRIFGAGQIK